MQTFQLEVNDTIADKILWLLNNFHNDVKIKRIPQEDNPDTIAQSVAQGLKEAKLAETKKQPLENAWDLVDEL